MERKAILIDSSDVRGETDLPGARVDIENWISFLSSPLGGSWRSDEIVRLHKPSPTSVATLLEHHQTSYCFVAFSGHGIDGYVALSDTSQRCPLSSLLPQGARGTLIADSCRSIGTATNFAAILGKSAAVLAEEAPVMKYASDGTAVDFASLADKRTPNLERKHSSETFRKKLSVSGHGIVCIQSCSSGEDAGEYPSSGGLYTSALLDAALKFHQRTPGHGVLTTKQAHDHASILMPAQQNPEYTPGSLAYPFAVKVMPIFAF